MWVAAYLFCCSLALRGLWVRLLLVRMVTREVPWGTLRTNSLCSGSSERLLPRSAEVDAVAAAIAKRIWLFRRRIDRLLLRDYYFVGRVESVMVLLQGPWTWSVVGSVDQKDKGRSGSMRTARFSSRLRLSECHTLNPFRNVTSANSIISHFCKLYNITRAASVMDKSLQFLS